MKELPSMLVYHEITGMSIPYSEHVGCNTLPSHTLYVVLMHGSHLNVSIFHCLWNQFFVWIPSCLASLSYFLRFFNLLTSFYIVLLLCIFLLLISFFFFYQLVVFILEKFRINFLFEVVINSSLRKGTSPKASPFMHCGNDFGVIYEFNVANLISCFHNFVPHHHHVHVLFHPHFVHDSKELKDQIILS